MAVNNTMCVFIRTEDGDSSCRERHSLKLQLNLVLNLNSSRRHNAENWSSPVDNCVFDGAETFTAVGECCRQYWVEVHASELES